MKEEPKEFLKFPDGFLWGASTAAHQVEGGTHNQWSEWEKQNASRLAKEAQKLWQLKTLAWESIRADATDPNNYISGRAADHYHLYEQDFELAKSLNMTSQRISIEWSRIEPEEGKFDQSEIEHYRKVVKAITSRGMEPFVTLYHWTLPLWLANKGGWENPKAIAHFSRYASIMVEALKDDVKFWITLNEPEVYTDFSYRLGQWPPAKKNIFTSYGVLKNLIQAHIEAYGQIKVIQPSSMVGISKNNIYFNLHRHLIVDYVVRHFVEAIWNQLFLRRIKNCQDFIGLNHYFEYTHKRNLVGLGRPHEYSSDLGWSLKPESIYYVLVGLARYGKPIYITEHGLADRKDNYREWYIKNGLRSVHKAISEGVDVRGYSHWSLLDNFEWDKGFWPRFGLIAVDYNTLERKVRPSALVYAQIIKNNGLEAEDELRQVKS